MMDQMKESGEKWGPKQWFEAGKSFVATPEPVVQPEFFEDDNDNDDKKNPFPTPEVYSDEFSSNLFMDDEPIKVWDDHMLGADYDEYDMYEDYYMRPEERYWEEKPRGPDYQLSNWEKRNQFRQHYNDYAMTIPDWNSFIPDETQQQINDFRSGYSGKKAWFKSKDFNIDLSGMQNDWLNSI